MNRSKKKNKKKKFKQNSRNMKEIGNTKPFLSSLIDFINYYFTVIYGIEINN